MPTTDWRMSIPLDFWATERTSYSMMALPFRVKEPRAVPGSSTSG
jgi:hypothetical protein